MAYFFTNPINWLKCLSIGRKKILHYTKQKTATYKHNRFKNPLLVVATATVTLFVMALSDTVLSNLTIIYVTIIVCIKLYGFLSGRTFTGAFILIMSTTAVILILISTLAWDVSRKATYAFNRHNHSHDVITCKGGICWHGVAVRSPASQVRFRLPQQMFPIPNAAF
ncbi:uncharacterized protein LOC131657522 [Vicia villosa]|uniref:uncharacterized protein LOC131657522 n=1 Tax=Vicia villosa TaxID=3911 RepID=UPI00273B7B6C|nr:uncharacterized protein LOC131657522 [Vicia villosa]